MKMMTLSYRLRMKRLLFRVAFELQKWTSR